MPDVLMPLTRILVQEGASVPIGIPIAVINPSHRAVDGATAAGFLTA
jgi:pyruvate/2-oxoglutarate dehydrogenase complex dihydrolipoamide acyltransferase (E2) component